MIKKYFIHLNSLDTNEDPDLIDHSNFNLQFNNQVFSSLTDKDRIFVYPIRCTIPWTWSNITNRNNHFVITHADDSTQDIYLDFGSPSSVLDLASNITTTLQNDVESSAGLSWDNLTKRFKFSWALGTIKKIDFKVANSCYQILGFRKKSYSVSSLTELEGDHPPDLTSTITVRCLSNVAKRSFGIINGVLANNQTFFSFSVGNNTVGDNIVFENDTEMFLHEIDPSFSNISLKFEDQDKQPLEVSGPVEIILGVIVEKQDGDLTQQVLGKLRNPV